MTTSPVPKETTSNGTISHGERETVASAITVQDLTVQDDNKPSTPAVLRSTAGSYFFCESAISFATAFASFMIRGISSFSRSTSFPCEIAARSPSGVSFNSLK